jgi:hypothetical protein
VIPDHIINADADKPAEQEVELQPLHQLPLRPDRIERLQKHRAQKASRAGSTVDPANPRFQINVAKQSP